LTEEVFGGMRNCSFILLIVFLIAGCTDSKPKGKKPVAGKNGQIESIGFTVVKTYPHDRTIYTEGFLFHDNKLFESSGSPENFPGSRSMIGIVNLKDGSFDKKIELDRTKYFGEGIVFLNDKLYQLTYKNQTGFIYDANTFVQKGTFSFSSIEGWGMTTDGTNLLMSDGTDKITYLDPDSLSVIRILNVTFNGSPALYINELEYINGFIYANIWTTNNIARIDPVTGKVTGIVDLSSLFREARKEYSLSEATNGIAFDPSKDRILVTGKFWPYIYHIDFSH
jgi:glutaminyl-peptide cyclotransferase